MRFVTVFVGMMIVPGAEGFTTHKPRTEFRNIAVSLPAISTPLPPDASSSSNTNKNQNSNVDFSNGDTTRTGRMLEGGKVIDFSSVKASCQAETALAEARKLVLAKGHHAGTTDAILGINQDVIQLVGHNLGAFCDGAEIQACAAHLRAQAPPGLLPLEDELVPKAVAVVDEKRCREILNLAYVEAGEVTSAFAKTFYMGTMLMSVARCCSIMRNTVVGSKRRTITCLVPSMVETCGRPQPLA